MLSDGCHALAAGKLAAVVTTLEMTARAPARPEAAGPWSLRRELAPTTAWYRELYARMGRDWLWFSRLATTEDELAAIIRDPQVHIYAVDLDGGDHGLLELDFRQPDMAEIAFFALDRSLQGRGAGRWLMNRALDLAWAQPIGRLWVHTCTLDHPDALGFYQRSGFTACRRQVEVADDPRLSGLLPRESAPATPLL